MYVRDFKLISYLRGYSPHVVVVSNHPFDTPPQICEA